MKLSEALDRIDITEPLYAGLEFDITTQTDSATDTYDVGSQDFFVNSIDVTVITDAGDNLNIENTVYDDMVVSVKSSNNRLFMDKVVSLRALCDKTMLNRGWLLQSNIKYTFEISGNAVGTSTFADYPVKVRLALKGYKLS